MVKKCARVVVTGKYEQLPLFDLSQYHDPAYFQREIDYLTKRCKVEVAAQVSDGKGCWENVPEGKK